MLAEPARSPNHGEHPTGRAGDRFRFTRSLPPPASEAVANLDHVKIGAGGVVAVDAGIGIVQEPVAEAPPFADRQAGPDGQGELERAAVVLGTQGMPADQSEAGPGIEYKPSTLAGDSDLGNQRHRQGVFAGGLQQPGTRRQLGADFPARFDFAQPGRGEMRREVIGIGFFRLGGAESSCIGDPRPDAEAQQRKITGARRFGGEQTDDHGRQQ